MEIDIGGSHMLLLGDAVTHPVQLEEPAWHSFEHPRVTGSGRHFAALVFGRVDSSAGGRTWST